MKRKRSDGPASLVSASIDQAILEAALKAGKNPAAVILGRMGGLKGGAARAVKLSAERRSEIAQKAAKTRWQSK